MTISDSFHSILNKLPIGINLVAVSKTRSIEEIEEMYHCGQLDFGENKVQELINKYDQLPTNIRWHQIGHLQKNKVKYIAPFIYLIHSVDSKELLKTIEKEAIKNNRILSVLLQIKISQEDSKYGLTFEDAITLLEDKKNGNYSHVIIKGLMGMASFTDNSKQVEKEFSSLHNFFTSHQKEFDLTILSMGMSDDFPIAIKCGSTMVRIGTKLFGKRNYTV